MSLRRPHLKSRNGCLQCKGRKIKCDEAPLVCGACLKSRITCSFTKDQSPPSLLPGLTAPQAAAIIPSNVLELELIHNFTTKTATTLTRSQRSQQFFQNDLVQCSFTCDYLLHTILALSAFHLEYQKGQLYDSMQGREGGSFAVTEKYRIAAFLYHNKALSSFRQALSHVTQENCHYFFICGGFLVLTSAASRRTRSLSSHEKSAAPSPLSPILECIELMRGSHLVQQTADTYEWIKSGPMSAMVLSVVEGYESSMDEIASVEIASLISMLQQKSFGEKRKVCQTAAEELRQTFRVDAGEKEIGIVFSWPSTCSSEYLALLKADEPEALLVMAYWCVLLNKINWCWIVEGWAQDILKTIITSILDETWKPWLRWPIDQVIRPDAG